MKSGYFFLKSLLSILFCVAGMAVVSAQTNSVSDCLYVSDIVAWRSNTSYLPVMMDNTHDIAAVQFNIGIPKVMKVEKDAFRLSDRTSDHVIQASCTDSDNDFNWYLVMVYSPTNAPLAGRTGKILDIRFTMSDNAQEGTQLTVPIREGVMSTSDRENVLRDTREGHVSIEYGPDLVITSVDTDCREIGPDGILDVRWTVSNIGEETCTAGWNEEICITDADATYETYGRHTLRYIGTIRCENELAGQAAVSRNASVRLPSLVGTDGDCRVLVRIVPFPESNERPESRINNVTLSNQSIEIRKQLSIELGNAVVEEQDTRKVYATINRSGRWDKEETFNIKAIGDSRVSVPENITLQAGQSAARFEIHITDNDILDPVGQTALIEVSDPSASVPYASVSASLSVTDDEKPALAIRAITPKITEGESVRFEIEAEREPEEDILLNISSDLATRFEFPIQVILAAGERKTEFVALARDDDNPANIESPTFTVSAAGYQSASTFLLLYDDDMPDLELSIAPATVGENSGIMSMEVSLRRTSNIGKEITVKLSDDSESGDIYYGEYSSFKMEAGVEETKFTLGVIDNFTVDGNRDVTLTASVYIQSCGCSPEGGSVGAATGVIHIFDNDGPTLTLTSSRSMLSEGSDNATVLTVMRNTSVNDPLSVTVSSDYEEGLQYQHSAVIPAGEKSVSIPVSVLVNQMENDSRTISFIAMAEGHNNGICMAMVTDRTMADAVITGFELLSDDGTSIENGRVTVGSFVTARVTIMNSGVIALPAGMDICFYQSGESGLTKSVITAEPIEAGDSFVQECSLYTGFNIGTFSAYAKVNENGRARELLTNNNTSAIASVSVVAPFKATISTDKTVLQYGDSLKISGRLVNTDGSVWKGGSSTVQVYVFAEGNRRSTGVRTDSQGNFECMWTPEKFDMGHFSIGACYPGEELTDEQAGVDIYGMRFVPSDENYFYTVLDQSYTGVLKVCNPGRLPLTGLTISVIENPDAAAVVFDTPVGIDGGETAFIRYTLTGHVAPTEDEWQRVRIRIAASQGPELSKTLYYYTRNSQAQLSCGVGSITSTMTKGSTRDYHFNIANIGMGNTGEVSISLPSWMQSVTPQRMASLSTGDTAQVVIRFAPTEDMQLNVPVTGRIGINCENGNGLAIPFSIEPVSEMNGTLLVDVCDEYTYYTEEAPHLADAKIQLLHPVTGAVLAEGTSDGDGLFAVTMPEGYYTLSVTHPKHSSYRNIILVDPGRTVTKTVNLSYNAIEIDWTVIETTVEDRYEILTTVKYETQVPMPVVTVDMPESVPAKELAAGESLVFYATLTNEGLITARDVEFTMPEGFKSLQFEKLDYTEPFDLAPKQSVVVPIRISHIIRLYASSPDPDKPLDEESCYANTLLGWYYECGTDRMYHKYPTGLRIGKCEGVIEEGYTPSGGTSAQDYFYGITYWFSDGKSTPNRPDTSTGQKLFDLFAADNQKKVESTGEPYQCEPCKNQVLLNLAKLLPVVGPMMDVADVAKDVNNCIVSFKAENNLHDKMAGCKYSSGIVKKYDNAVNELNNIKNDIGDAFDDLVTGGNYISDIVDNAKNNKLFSYETLNDLMGLYGSINDMCNETKDAISRTSDLTDNVIDEWNKASDVATSIAKKANDKLNKALKEKREYEEWTKRSEIFNPNYGQDLFLDRKANGYDEQKSQQIRNAHQKLIEQTIAKEIASDNDYNNIANAFEKVLSGESLSKKDISSLGQSAVRVLGEQLYNSHDFDTKRSSFDGVEWMVPLGVDLDGLSDEDIDLLTREKRYFIPTTEAGQALLKDAYLNSIKQITDKIPDVVDLLHDTFGECKFEGDNNDERQNLYAASQNNRMKASSGGSIQSGSVSIIFNTIPSSYQIFMNNMIALTEIIRSEQEMTIEYYGSEKWLELDVFQIQSVSWAIEKVIEEGPEIIDGPGIGVYCPEGISEEMLRSFLHRWYNTYLGKSMDCDGRMKSSTVGTVEENVINLDRMDELSNFIRHNVKVITDNNTRSIREVIYDNIRNAYEDLTGGESVCASISVQFDQTMVTTRQAFRGTLNVRNGNPDYSMENVILEVEVRNVGDGSIATSREMQISAETLDGFVGNLNLTDGWSLAPNSNGTVTILFIPSRYAAPTEPQEYTFGGRLKYLDPYTQTVVTRELSNVTLTVRPCADLELTYFVQRDVLGDDPLTQDVIEPSEDAEFALLIHNRGYGEASNVVLETSQPEIVDNAKGLLVEFELTGSKLDGQDFSLSLSRSITSDFGRIASGESRYAQWMLRSSVLGHFTEYDVRASHVTSYGNPDLSLLSQVSIHELIRSIDAGAGKTGFLVNDIVDVASTPDMLYVTDASSESVSPIADAQIVPLSATEYKLTVTPSAAGWNYGNIIDPTYGVAKLVSIVRQGDGQPISIRNFWQTDRTLRDGKDPLYENRIHFSDCFSGTEPHEYLIGVLPVPSVRLEVMSFAGIPEDDGILLVTPLDYVDVTFNKGINPASFTVDDLTYTVQGIRQDVSGIVISTEDNVTFRLDLRKLNEVTGNGYHILTVQTSGITDLEGFCGSIGKNVGWNLMRDGLAVISVAVNPAAAGVVTLTDSLAEIISGSKVSEGDKVTLSATPNDGYSFVSWTSQGQIISESERFVYNVIGDADIQANFKHIQYYITVTQAENGTISDLSGYYNFGDTITLTARPRSSYTLEYWIVNGEKINTGTEISLIVNQPISISAQFTREIYRQEMMLRKGWNWVSTYIEEPMSVSDFNYGVARIIGQQGEVQMGSNNTGAGNLTSVLPMESYKVKANYDTYITHSGHLLTFATAVETIGLWKWIGYPWNTPRLLDEAFADVSDGDCIISQTGFAEYYDGYWEGTLTVLKPGDGYIYRASGPKTVRYASEGNFTENIPEDEDSISTIDVHSFPNAMNIIADLSGSNIVYSSDRYVIYAMSATECRGKSEYIGGHYYITVYGEPGENISFMIQDNTTENTVLANETMVFTDGIVGDRKAPFQIISGDITGIKSPVDNGIGMRFGIDGIRIDNAEMPTDVGIPSIIIINRHKYLNN